MFKWDFELEIQLWILSFKCSSASPSICALVETIVSCDETSLFLFIVGPGKLGWNCIVNAGDVIRMTSNKSIQVVSVNRNGLKYCLVIV